MALLLRHWSTNETQLGSGIGVAKSLMVTTWSFLQETESHKPVDDEWYRRRSERIFLHEASVGSVSSPPGTASSQISGLDDRSLPSSPTKTTSKPRSLSQDVVPKNLASCLKSELSVSVKSCTPTTSDVRSKIKSCALNFVMNFYNSCFVMILHCKPKICSKITGQQVYVKRTDLRSEFWIVWRHLFKLDFLTLERRCMSILGKGRSVLVS